MSTDPQAKADESDVYTHGHHESVLRSHSWRTAENSAGYLIPTLRPGLRLLDVGSGPGTITLGLAKYLQPGGEAIGLDREAKIIEDANALAADQGVSNARFVVGDVYNLDFIDASFDVVHAHQVMQHLANPVGALREIRRVLRKGGTLAVRDSDYGAKIWGPQDARLDRWMELYHQVTEANGAQADAGRYLPGWVREAGFSNIEVSSTTWTFSDAATTKWWGELWADRTELSAYADQAISYGLSDRDELGSIATAWRQWSVDPAAFIVILGVEVLANP